MGIGILYRELVNSNIVQLTVGLCFVTTMGHQFQTTSVTIN